MNRGQSAKVIRPYDDSLGYLTMVCIIGAVPPIGLLPFVRYTTLVIIVHICMY